jgi:RHS repeat-associated protein
VQVSVQTATPIASTKQFIWIGNRIAEERDASNNVLRRFYPQGEQISGASYFYTRDHLGSVRELTDSSAIIRARYDYDPYGSQTKVSGDLDAEFGYTGHYFHQPSSMNLALHRAYDSVTGRWLSRDPLKDAEMIQGPNLYAYVRNDSLNKIDRMGTDLGDWWDVRTWFNSGLTESLGMTWHSLQDVTGDFLTGNWDRLPADAADNPLGQTENCPVAYYTEWGLLGISGAADLTAGGLIAADAAGYTSLFGRGGLFNSNDYLRIGWGWNNNIPGEVFRISIGGPRLPIWWHVDLWPW